MPGTIRASAITGAAVALGLGVYWFDNVFCEGLGESTLRRTLNVLEIVLLGPGMGLLAWLVFQNFRLKEEQNRRRVERERTQRFQALGKLAASVAHEVRNPLHNLRLIAEGIGETVPPEAQPLIARMEANLARIDQAVSLAYELSRPVRADEGGMGSVDLEALIASLVEELRTARGTHGQIRHVPAASPIQAHGHEAGIRFGLGNLLRNALEAGGDGPVVVACATREAKTCEITIENPGTLPAAVLTGSGEYRSIKPGGLGIGIAIARQLIANAGGSIVFSNSDGKVIAQVVLPRAVPAAAQAAERSSNA